FLAPTKPLVEQHAASLRKVLVVDRIALFTGEATSPEERELLWRENKIVVSTPQVIRNDIRAERISLDDVSLVVFDEAHRAAGDEARKRLDSGVRDGRLYGAMTAQAIAMKANHAMELAETQGLGSLRSYFDKMEAETKSKADVQFLKHARVQEAIKLARESDVEHPKLAKTGWVVR